MYWPYLAPMCVVILCSMTGTERMIRTALAIGANWALGTAFVFATGIHDPWLFSILIDGLAAFILLYPPAGKVQALIGACYIVQILIHFIYSRLDHVVAAYPYWQLLTGIAFAQLALLGGWIGGHWGRRYFAHRRRSQLALAHDAKGVG